jgi:inner membrane protein involved in colicin E2 resistance
MFTEFKYLLQLAWQEYTGYIVAMGIVSVATLIAIGLQRF